jgi:hypothetical protein
MAAMPIAIVARSPIAGVPGERAYDGLQYGCADEGGLTEREQGDVPTGATHEALLYHKWRRGRRSVVAV